MKSFSLTKMVKGSQICEPGFTFSSVMKHWISRFEHHHADFLNTEEQAQSRD